MRGARGVGCWSRVNGGERCRFKTHWISGSFLIRGCLFKGSAWTDDCGRRSCMAKGQVTLKVLRGRLVQLLQVTDRYIIVLAWIGKSISRRSTIPIQVLQTFGDEKMQLHSRSRGYCIYLLC